MTFTDVIILGLTVAIAGLILYRMMRKKEDSSCSRCSYAKKK